MTDENKNPVEKPVNPTAQNALLYVAPIEAPPDRRPPLTEVGVIKWLKDNLFSSVNDTIMTLITLALVISFLSGFLDWAIFEAQWEIDFLNLRILNVGTQYPISEVWRVETVAMLAVFLTMMSVAVWGKITRAVIIIAAVIAAMMIIMPVVTEPVPEPRIYTWVENNYEIRQMRFIAEEGQTVQFTVDPLITPEEYKIDTLSGYIENNNQSFNTSFDKFTEADTQITFQQTRDPSEYELSIAVQVLDEELNVIYESDFTGDSTEEQSFEWTAPASGWYVYTPVLSDESGEAGAAWLKADNIEVYRSTLSAQEERVAQYGEQPEIDCELCATSANRTDMRYEGRRTLGQWFSIQLTPFLLETRDFYFLALFTGIVGYLLGRFGRFAQIQSIQPMIRAWRKPLSRLAIGFFVAYLVLTTFGSALPADVRQPIYTGSMIGFVVFGVLLVTNYMLGETKQFLNRAMSLLWGISIPVTIFILTGVVGSTLLPPISTDNYGGLLLTLMLAAVAIIVSFPIGIALALGRQSSLPVVSLLSTIFIEVLRGVPLITLLFMGRLILPFFGFGLADVSLVVRTMVVLTLFTSAYMAEVVRGGLQIIPSGQIEAAQALGLNNFWTTYLITLPQALRAVIPAIMGQAVSLFKDTSLVFIIGLLEILGTMNQILGDSLTGYLAFPREGYLFIGAVYFIFSYIMADISRRIERTGSGVARRDTV